MINRTNRACSARSVMNRPNGNCHAAMHRLQAIDFSLVDTILYLDAYPDSPAALAHYHKLHEERERLLQSMAAEGCPPITAMDVHSQNGWSWVNGPWPWEADAN